MYNIVLKKVLFLETENAQIYNNLTIENEGVW